jgi:hypothetical protein
VAEGLPTSEVLSTSENLPTMPVIKVGDVVVVVVLAVDMKVLRRGVDMVGRASPLPSRILQSLL